jgi:hypothetical protein
VAERHEDLVRVFRRKLVANGYAESKCPLHTCKPDIFAVKRSTDGRVLREIIVEAEIEATLFSEHTSHQLVIIHEYIAGRRRRGLSSEGVLLVPKGKVVGQHARFLLESLFATRGGIRVISM